MAADVAGFQAQFPNPQFEGADTAAIQRAIEEAEFYHSRRPLATLYCAAHLLALESEHTGKPDGGSGVVASERIGPKTISYLTQAGTGQNADDRKVFFATSSYGRRFLALEARTPRAAIGAVVVGA